MINSIEDIQIETVNYFCENPDCLSTEGRRSFFYKARLDGILADVNNNLAPREVLVNVVKYLQMQNSYEIINLLKLIDIGNNKQLKIKLNELVESWERIATHPIKYIYSNYIEKKLKDKRYIKLDEVYIDLYGEEEIKKVKQKLENEINTIGVEVTEFWNSIERNEIDLVAKDEKNPIIDTIVNISQYKDQFIVIGAPGCGKTTTLQKIFYQNLLRIKEGDKIAKLPILILANEFNIEPNFEYLLLKEFPYWKDYNIDKSKFLILVDGINEIIPSKQVMAMNQLQNILNDDKFEHTSVIISGRKYGFSNNFGLSVFEIKQLNDTQVKNYIAAYRPNEQEVIWKRIQDDKHLYELAFNPLTLFMITWVDWHHKIIPNSRGLLFRYFINQILNWEKKVGSVIELLTKIELLSEVAILMRIGDFSLSFKEVQERFNQKLNNNDKTNQLIDILCNNYILKTNSARNISLISFDERISFVHESFLEYFSAVALQKLFIETNKLPIDYTDTEWFETLKITSDLFNEKEELIKFIGYLFSAGNEKVIRKNLGKGVIDKNRIYLTEFEWEIEREDFNLRMDIACKVAYNIRLRFPDVYNLFEKFLNNQLYFWSKYYYLKVTENNPVGEEIIPFENILAACAGLSSEKIFTKLFYSDTWTFIWLDYYNDEIWQNHINKKFTERTNAFFDNLSDYELVYNILIQNNSAMPYNCTIKLLRPLKDIVTNKMPLKLSKDLFLKDQSLHLLERIGREDLDFYINNYNTEKHDLKPFINYLLSFSYNKQAQQKLITFLSHPQITVEQRNDILSEFLSNYFAVPTILRYIENNFEYLMQHQDISNKINIYLNHLPQNLIPDIFKKKNYLKYEKISNNQIKLLNNYTPTSNKNIVIIDEKNIGYAEVLQSDFKKVVSYIILSLKKGDLLNFPKSGVLTHQLLSIKYDSWFINKSQNINIQLSNDPLIESDKFVSAEIKKYTFYVENDNNTFELSFIEHASKKICNNFEYSIIYEGDIEQFGKIRFLKQNISFDILSIQYNLKNEKLIDTIKRNFQPKIETRNYAIILRIFLNINKVTIYSPSKNEHYQLSIYNETLQTYNENQIILFEDDYIYHIDREMQKEKLGYIKSFVCSVQDEYYFIFNKTGKDFFVHKSYSPIVKKDDIVSFYPSINLSFRNYKKPLAKNIEKESISIEERDLLFKDFMGLNENAIIFKLKNEIAVEPDNVFNLNKLASYYISCKNFKLAEMYLAQSKKTEKDNIFTLFLIAQLNCRMRNYDLAITIFHRLHSQFNSNAIFITEYINSLLKNRSKSKALHLGKTFLSNYGYTYDTLPVLLKTFEVLIHQNNIEEIESLLQQVPSSISDQLYSVKLNLAKIYEEQNNVLASEYYFEKGLQNNHNAFDYIAFLVFLYRYGKFDKLQINSNKAFNLVNSDERLFDFNLQFTEQISKIKYISIYGNFKDENKAITILKPKLAEVDRLYRSGEIIKAIKLLKGIIIRKSPIRDEAKEVFQRYTKKIFQKEGDIIKSFHHYEIALSISNLFWTRLEFAYALFYSNEYLLSLEVCNSFISTVKGHSATFNLLADNYKALGEFDNAKINYDNAITYSTNNFEKAKYYNKLLLLIIDLKQLNYKYSAYEYLKKGKELNPDYDWFYETEKKLDKLFENDTHKNTTTEIK